MSGIDNSISNNNGVCKDTVIVFPALELFMLDAMPNMREWVEVELASASENQSRQVKVFPCLEYLEIRNCNELRSAPSHFPCLKEMRMEEMESGLPLANICGTKLTSLTKLEIWGLKELECLPSELFYKNQHLVKFSIRDCPRLRELADGLHTLISLQELRIQNCPSLKSIPDCSSGRSFGSLSSLVIEDCQELMHLSADMVESCAPTLECLQLGGLRKITNTQQIMDCLHKIPRLTKLALHLPKFIFTSSADTPTFHSLRELSMGPDSDSWNCVSFKEAVDGILMRIGSNSLRKLKLSGKEDWETLSNQLQHLFTLRILYLQSFGIEELLEWFGNLTSLQELTLFNCKELRSLPSVEAMRRLTNLTHLFIRDCAVLKEKGIEQQTADDDSQ